jgi:hypothetical protein
MHVPAPEESRSDASRILTFQGARSAKKLPQANINLCREDCFHKDKKLTFKVNEIRAVHSSLLLIRATCSKKQRLGCA